MSSNENEQPNPYSYQPPGLGVTINTPSPVGTPLNYLAKDIDEFGQQATENPQSVALLLGAYLDPHGRTLSGNQDITQLATRFQTWREKRNTTQLEHENYVKGKQDRPGRDQTIKIEPGSVLGAGPQPVDLSKGALG